MNTLARLMTWSIVISCSATVFGADGTWKLSDIGNWDDPLSWTGGIPNNVGDTATFGATLPSSEYPQVTLNSPIVISNLVSYNPKQIFITGTNPLTFDAGDQEATIQIGMNSKQIKFSSTVNLASDLRISAVGRNNSQLMFWGLLTGNGGLILDHGEVSGSNCDYQGITRVNGGLLSLNKLGDSTLPTYVASRNAALVISSGKNETIYLENSSGFAYGGALLARGNGQDFQLSGPVDLGDVGSYIGVVRNQASINFHGPITGGFLKIASGTHLITGSGVAYTGVTEIGRENSVSGLDSVSPGLIVGENATLTTTSRIIVNRDGQFTMSYTSGIDRVADHIPLTLNGGQIRLRGDSGSPVEYIGTVSYARGHSVTMVDFDTDAFSAGLTASSFNRSPGTVVTYMNGDRGTLGGTDPTDPHIFFQQMPVLTGGIIGGWAYADAGYTFNADFATYDVARGVYRLGTTGRAADVEGAGPLDNVLTTAQTATLSQDTKINSLKMGYSAPLNLGGFTLNIVSGGLMGTSQIMSGQLTAGDTTPGTELVIKGSVSVRANIVDNSGGAVGLTIAGSSTVTLSGTNTYTGPTVVNASPFVWVMPTSGSTLIVASANSVPANNDLILNGGIYRIDFTKATPLALNSLTVRDNGYVYCNSGFLTYVDADSYAVESGAIHTQLAGNGPMTKTTDGMVRLTADNSNYSGTISLQEGLLAAESQYSLGANAVTVNPSGRLLVRTANLVGNIILAGGELAPANPSSTTESSQTFAGSLSITANSRILTYDGLLTENVDLINFKLTGPLTIAPGVALDIVGARPLTIQGNVTLGRGASINTVGHRMTILVPSGSALTGSGSIDAQVAIGNGATVAPGNSADTLTVTQASWYGGGVYIWETTKAQAVDGVDSDLFKVIESLAISSNTSNRFTIRMVGIGSDGHEGALVDFNPNKRYSWRIATAASITGFDTLAFNLDTSHFISYNPIAPSATFSLYSLQNNVFIQYSGVPLTGDTNNDGVVNNQDIASLILALTDTAAWVAAYPTLNVLDVCDINGDNMINNQDIAPFVTLLTGGGTAFSAGEFNAIPEPASLGLVAIGGLMLLNSRQRRS